MVFVGADYENMHVFDIIIEFAMLRVHLSRFYVRFCDHMDFSFVYFSHFGVKIEFKHSGVGLKPS